MTAATTETSTTPYLGGLDGVRGAACLAVVTAHCWGHFAPETTPTGTAQLLSVGLVMFFAMSGLLIYLPFVRDIASGRRRVAIGRYARRRLARVFPAYLLIFVVCNAVGAVYVENAVDVATPNSDVGTGAISDPLLLVANLTLTQTFFPGTIQTGINPSWSLTTELTFYAILPVLAVPLARRSQGEGTRSLLLALLPAGVLLVAGLAGRTWAELWAAGRPELDTFNAEFGANGVAVLSRSLLGLADNFAVGMVVAVLFVWMERGSLEAWTRRRIVAVGVPVVLACGAAGVLLHERAPWFTGSAMALASAVVLLLLVEPTARRTPSQLVRWVGNRPLDYVGRISLSVYLWHYPVIVLASRFGLVGGDTAVTMVWAPVLVAGASLLLGSLTYAWVERPAMTWASR